MEPAVISISIIVTRDCVGRSDHSHTSAFIAGVYVSCVMYRCRTHSECTRIKEALCSYTTRRSQIEIIQMFAIQMVLLIILSLTDTGFLEYYGRYTR